MIFKSLLRKSTLIAFLTSSVSAFAFHPTISFNESSCTAITKGNLTSCFQNKVNGYLSGYQLKQTYISENGSTMELVANIDAMQPGFFTVISSSSADFEKYKIVSASFSIIKGDANKYQVVPGCNTEFTDKSISKSVVSIYRVNGVLHCE